MIQYGVAALAKDMPFSADCALSWIIWVALSPLIQPCWATKFLCCIYDIHDGLLAGAIIIVACSLLQTGLTVPERLVNVS
jgi:hypothetical protein